MIGNRLVAATGIHDHSVAATRLFTARDAYNDAIAKYAFWDTGGTGHWVVNGVAQAANTEIDVSAACVLYTPDAAAEKDRLLAHGLPGHTDVD
ncbi:hypothetical protein IXO278_20585 [Xanthomonas oryzae pv. oryzae]|nr:hypothetical protein IXO278_20585 [Xanthomonas oryzae pv. oryzae]